MKHGAEERGAGLRVPSESVASITVNSRGAQGGKSALKEKGGIEALAFECKSFGKKNKVQIFL